MSKILAIWLTIYFGGIVLALVHPIYPFVSYLAFYYAPPHVNWWGRYLPDLRWSLLASLVMLGAIVIRSGGLERLKNEKNPALIWALLFAANIVVVTVWALDRARSWYWTVVLLKMLLLYALIPFAVRTPAQFDIFAATHIGGASYWGFKAWDNPKRKDGRLEDVGGPDTQNDNQAAGHLLTVLPFVAVYAFAAKRYAARAAVIACGAFIVNVFILCNSRGATLGLLAMVGAAILFGGKGRRAKLLAVAAAGILAVFALADPEFIARQQTTTNPQDGSAEGRLEAWRAGLNVMRDYPMGAGGRAFHILSPKYIPDIVEEHRGEERSVHNTYIQLASEWGIQGLILWSGFMGSTFLLLRRCSKRSRENPWFFYRFLAIELALIGTLVSGIFTSRLYGESVYWMCALAVALYRMHATEVAEAPVPGTDAVLTSLAHSPAMAGMRGAPARCIS